MSDAAAVLLDWGLDQGMFGWPLVQVWMSATEVGGSLGEIAGQVDLTELFMLHVPPADP